MNRKVTSVMVNSTGIIHNIRRITNLPIRYLHT
jgi:hypothetical protein